MQVRPAGSPLTADMSSVRNATNLRTVSRNDPSVSEILDTSTYSVIYHYDADAGKWQKQKQEGSLFVVRRTKAPEFALFMLNRVSVKNVTIPLIPGEMKATAIDASMLQVARRGEKIRYGIWFTEGEGGVQRFRDTIVRVCGEPSKNGVSARASPLPLSSSAATALPPSNLGSSSTVAALAPPAGGNDLNRLFASMTTVPARTSGQPSPQPQPPSSQPQSQPQSHPLAPQPMPPQAPLQAQQSLYDYGSPLPGYPAPGPYASIPTSAPLPGAPPQQQYPQQAPAPVPPPPATTSSYAPGQTVDDLLMSILGPPVPPPQGPAPVHLGLGTFSASAPPTATLPIGPGFPPMVSPGGPHPMSIISGPCGPGPISNYCAPHPSSTAPLIPPPPQGRPINGSVGPGPVPLAPNDPTVQPLRDAVARSLPNSNSSSPPALSHAPPDFRAFLADLVMQPNNAWFVDQVFAAYTQNLEREAKRHSQPQQQQQPQNQNQAPNQSQGQNQGPRRGGNRGGSRGGRGRNQQQQQQQQ